MMVEIDSQKEPKKKHSGGWISDLASFRGSRTKRVIIAVRRQTKRMRSNMKMMTPMIVSPVLVLVLIIKLNKMYIPMLNVVLPCFGRKSGRVKRMSV
jgi:hypothetical protein